MLAEARSPPDRARRGGGLLFPSTDNTPGAVHQPKRHVAVRSRVHRCDRRRCGCAHAAGLRGPEHEARSESSRWLVLGDSFVMASRYRKTRRSWSASASTGVAFLNAGVDGYSAWQAKSASTAPDDRWGEGPDRRVLPRKRSPTTILPQMSASVTASRCPSFSPPPLAHRLFGGGHGSMGTCRLVSAAHGAAGRDPMAHRWHVKPVSSTRRVPTCRARLRTTERASELPGGPATNLPLMVAVAPAFAVHTERAYASLVGLDLGRGSAGPGSGCRCAFPSWNRILRPRSRPADCSGVEAVYLTFDGHWSAAGARRGRHHGLSAVEADLIQLPLGGTA